MIRWARICAALTLLSGCQVVFDIHEIETCTDSCMTAGGGGAAGAAQNEGGEAASEGGVQLRPCANRTLDAGESDVDCGGACPACGIGSHCDTAADCASGRCDKVGGAGQCVEPQSCAGELEPCRVASDCCFRSALCVQLPGHDESVCSLPCSTSDQCATKCCASLPDLGGACSDHCALGCHPIGDSCDFIEDCCGWDGYTDAGGIERTAICLETGLGRPGRCVPSCSDDALCDDLCCRQISAPDPRFDGMFACMPKALCTN